MGLTGYFRKFVKDYSRIALPLSEMLKKDEKFKFNEELRFAFNQLKSVLTTAPVLQLFRFCARTELHTDASQVGIGAVLRQENYETKHLHPVYYFSRKTTDQQKKWTSYQLEAYAIIETVKKFRVYLSGTNFKIITDCAAFKQTLRKKDVSPKVARWALFLEEFDYTIEHRPGRSLHYVDALSRSPILVINSYTNVVTSQIWLAQKKHDHLNAIYKILQKEEYEGYIVENDLLYKEVEGRK